MSVGIDITDVKKIEELSNRHKGFIERVYTPREINYCKRKRNKYQHFAGRFAAKESILKAIGTGWTNNIKWTDIEILNDPSGKPKVVVHGKLKELLEKKRIKDILISISHNRSYAVAYAQLVK